MTVNLGGMPDVKSGANLNTVKLFRAQLRVFTMTDNVVQLRDFQNPKDLERLRQALEREAAEIMKEVVPYHGAGIDGMWIEPAKEPAK